MADMFVTSRLNGGDNNEKTKTESKSKFFKLFRRKKKYKQFEVNNATHSKTADCNPQRNSPTTLNNWEKLTKLEKRRKGQRQRSPNPTAKDNKSFKTKYTKHPDTHCVHSGTQTTTFEDISAEIAEVELINFGQGPVVIERDSTHTLSNEHINLKKRGDSQQVKGDNVLSSERASYNKMTDAIEIEIVDENTTNPKSDGFNKNDSTKEVDNTYGKNKWHRSKRFQKLKRKLHLSDYRELHESSETIDDIVQSDDAGYNDVRKKKRLKQFGKNVRKALATGLKGMSPFTSPPDNTHNNSYYSSVSVVWF